MLFEIRVTQENIVHEGVLDVTNDADRRVSLGYGFDRQNRHEEGSARAAVFSRDFDSHQAHIEHLRQKARVQLFLLVHLKNFRSDGRTGKALDFLLKEGFVLAECGQRARVFWAAGHK